MFANIASGASAGSMFGPVGSAIGGLAGLGFGLFGASSAKKDAERAAQAAQAASQQQVAGLNNAIGERRAGTERSLGYLDTLQPFIGAGTDSLNYLRDAIGVNGAGAEQTFYDRLNGGPGWAATQKAGIGAIEGSQSAGGALRSGGTLKALQDYGMRLFSSFSGDRLNRLSGLATQGQQAAGQYATGGANISDRGSSDVAGYLKDIGIANAGGTINSSNAMSKGNENYLSYLGYGVGQMKPAINDLTRMFASGGGGGMSSVNYGDGVMRPMFGR